MLLFGDLCHIDRLGPRRLKSGRVLYFDLCLGSAWSPVLSKHRPAVIDGRKNARILRRRWQWFGLLWKRRAREVVLLGSR